MTSFISAMNACPTKKLGVKNSDVYTEEGLNDIRVSLFQMLVRNCSPVYIYNIIQSADEKYIRDLVVMAFQTRDIRGGKGERDIFYSMLLSIITRVPQLAEPLIRLVPEYGCWQDLWHLYYPEKILSHFEVIKNDVKKAIIDFTKWIFFEDLSKLANNSKPSLLGKWLPREDSKYHSLACILASHFYPDIPLEEDSLCAYRKACSSLNRALNTTEILMCESKKDIPSWSKINPSHVPGRLFKKSKAAFLNGMLLTYKGRQFNHNYLDAQGSTRYPNNQERIQCRKNFIEYLEKALNGTVKINGGNTVYPHELVKEILENKNMTKEISDVIESQWMQIRNEVLKSLSSETKNRIVPMSDFSGSMSGVPLYVSMALGILLSEINNPVFKDYMLTFDSNPFWLSFEGKKTLRDKVEHAIKYSKGLSTNFQKACELILERLITYNVPASEAPSDLVVFTDMGFDQASNENVLFNTKNAQWQTHIQMIRSNFEKYGYTAPRIVLWNLRAEYKDFHAKAKEDGVLILSGWSPAIMKVILSNNIEIKTPYQGLREILDNVRYDLVRETFDNEMTNILAKRV